MTVLHRRSDQMHSRNIQPIVSIFYSRFDGSSRHDSTSPHGCRSLVVRDYNVFTSMYTQVMHRILYIIHIYKYYTQTTIQLI